MQVRQIFERNKKWLCFVIVVVFIWGMVAHGYALVDNNMSHDSLYELDAKVFSNVNKMKSGRIVVPSYRQIFRCNISIPWLIGLLAFLWVGIAAFLVIKIFRIDSKLLVTLVAGIFIANTCFSAITATYIHDLDCDMFAVMCAVCAVYLWRRFSWGWLPGVLFLVGTLGIYQSMLFVAVTLLMLACILDLLDGCSFANVMTEGLKAIGMLLLGGGALLCAAKGAVVPCGIDAVYKQL